MNDTGKVDQDDIVRARNALLGSGRRTAREEVDAYRVLARVSPASYLPPLVRALQRLSYDGSSGTKHPNSLALCEEAVTAARSIDPAEPARADALYGALDSCQRELYSLGRRAEGLTLRAEMAAIGRAEAELSGSPVIRGLREWAAGLSEEGRYAEAADAMTELVSAMLPMGPREGALAWSLLEWIGALHNAGRSDETLAAFETLVGLEAAEAANDRGSMACHLYSLIGYAGMLDSYGRGGQAALLRQEALALLTELADTGERKVWSGYQESFWAALLFFSGAESDQPATGEPRPGSGAAPVPWSPDAQRRYAAGRHVLRDAVDTLTVQATESPGEHLAELVRSHRAFTVRSIVRAGRHTHLVAERARSLFDDGVGLARRLSQHDPVDGTRALARALIDRSTFHTAAHEYGAALDDFRQALSHLGEAY
ncbi:hypothetical protein [Streptomyces collinus]|uniref:hypothetical protein n=1 Tax=Streptomyces collinus TaxID=42684 RepID=UPI002942DBD3|nr:hypothetical protein [Streptomyces collinus]